MRIRFTTRATENLTEIADYLRVHSPQAALRVRTSILDSLQILVEFPNAGRLQSTDGVRKLVTRKYAYLIYYTVDNNRSEVVVLSIKHPSRERQHQDR